MPEPYVDVDLGGPAAPPRDNGGIVFAAPWEQRVFGLTLALCRSGVCEWETSRQSLIRHIADDETRPYWRSWAAALEEVVTRASVITQDELGARHRAILSAQQAQNRIDTPT